MKKITIILVGMIFPLLSSAASEIQLLHCEKKDFFYWGQPLVVKLIKYNEQKIIRYTYQNGIASTKVQQMSPSTFVGADKFLNVSLKYLYGDVYSFTAKDNYDGRLGVGPVQVICSRM